MVKLWSSKSPIWVRFLFSLMFFYDYDFFYNFLKKYLNKKHTEQRNFKNLFKSNSHYKDSDLNNSENFFFRINIKYFSKKTEKILISLGNYKNIFIIYFNFLKKIENKHTKLYSDIFSNFLKFLKIFKTPKFFEKNFKNNFKFENLKKIKFHFNNFFQNKIKFNNENTLKIINKNYDLDLFNNKSKIKIFFLRKNKIFNKGRYSRNRQIYRTGVYLCLWINILMVYGLYYIFYKIVFNFNYLWFVFINFIFLFIFIKIYKYNLFNLNNIFKEIYLIINWYNHLLSNFFNIFFKFLDKLSCVNFLKKFNYKFQNDFDYKFIENFKKNLENNFI